MPWKKGAINRGKDRIFIYTRRYIDRITRQICRLLVSMTSYGKEVPFTWVGFDTCLQPDRDRMSLVSVVFPA